MASASGNSETVRPRQAPGVGSGSTVGNPGASRTGRNMSNTPSFVSVTTISLHGNCPHCKHWHNKMRFSLNPLQYSRVHCQKCKRHWFSLGGNSTHSSLLSQETLASDSEDRIHPLALAICSTSAASLAFAAPGLQETHNSLAHLTSVAEAQSDDIVPPMPRGSEESSTSLLPVPSTTAEAESPAAAPTIESPELTPQAPSRPTDVQDPPTQTSNTPPQTAPKNSSRTRKRFKRILARLGFDVEFRISRIKRSATGSTSHNDAEKRAGDHQSHLADPASNSIGAGQSLNAGARLPQSYESSRIQPEDRQSRAEVGDDFNAKISPNPQNDTEKKSKREDSDTIEKRKQKRSLKTRLANADPARQRPIRCFCHPGCHCKRGSTSSVRAAASQSAPDLLFDLDSDRSEHRGQGYIEFMRHRQNNIGEPDQQRRSISPEIWHAGSAFPSDMPRPTNVVVSDDGQDRGERSRHVSYLTTSSHRLSGHVSYSESPRGSATVLGVPVAAAPSPYIPQSPRSHGSLTQDDVRSRRLDSESTQTSAQDIRRSREESGSDMDLTLDRRHSSGTADIREERRRYASLNSMASFSSFR
ncbi:hypothetical protein EV356DRAFT_343047 [Viridothelium virens]|uniref:Uncharacterized protein n=1 Tax=Viridothelium virens TaxID=1048519 RepID=A0A6A6GXE8_VIRVR|nr:hypothetical protein EV356DRAFT_343047 [Viridothelium virens]